MNESYTIKEFLTFGMYLGTELSIPLDLYAKLKIEYLEGGDSMLFVKNVEAMYLFDRVVMENDVEKHRYVFAKEINYT